MDALIPGLTVQPLLENAIYHGIEPLDDGGTVTVRGRAENGIIAIEISNPLRRDAEGSAHRGQGMAMQNIRDRLRITFDGKGSLETDESDGAWRVTLRFPETQ